MSVSLQCPICKVSSDDTDSDTICRDCYKNLEEAKDKEISDLQTKVEKLEDETRNLQDQIACLENELGCSEIA
jgi:peptidoglycan hydrolase CwlO-like protein